MLLTCAHALAVSTYTVSTTKEPFDTPNDLDETKLTTLRGASNVLVEWIAAPDELRATTVNNKIDLTWTKVNGVEYYNIYEKKGNNWEYIKSSYIYSNNFYASNGTHTYGVTSVWISSTGTICESKNITIITVTVYNFEDTPGKEDHIVDLTFSGKTDKEVTIDVYDNTYLHIITDSFTWMFSTNNSQFAQPDALYNAAFISLGNNFYLKATKHLSTKSYGLIRIATYDYERINYNGQSVY